VKEVPVLAMNLIEEVKVAIVTGFRRKFVLKLVLLVRPMAVVKREVQTELQVLTKLRVAQWVKPVFVIV